MATRCPRTCGGPCWRCKETSGGNMKAHEALIAWTPRKRDDRSTAGQVKVGPLRREGEPDWARSFSMTGGAAYTVVQEMRGAQSVAKLFVDFHTLIVRDG